MHPQVNGALSGLVM